MLISGQFLQIKIFTVWLASIAFIGLAVSELERRPKKTKAAAAPALPLANQIRIWMVEEEQKSGVRPTQAQAAEKFGASRATVSRHLNGNAPAAERLRLVS